MQIWCRVCELCKTWLPEGNLMFMRSVTVPCLLCRTACGRQHVLVYVIHSAEEVNHAFVMFDDALMDISAKWIARSARNAHLAHLMCLH